MDRDTVIIMSATLSDQVSEIRRELAQRENVYAFMVASGEMTRDVADRKIGIMQAVLATVLHVSNGD